MKLVLLGSMTRGGIVARARVTCHHRIPVIQAITWPAASAPHRSATATAGLRQPVFELNA
jgi:hypothetical protein